VEQFTIRRDRVYDTAGLAPDTLDRLRERLELTAGDAFVVTGTPQPGEIRLEVAEAAGAAADDVRVRPSRHDTVRAVVADACAALGFEPGWFQVGAVRPKPSGGETGKDDSRRS
jgi:hypothetical protein